MKKHSKKDTNSLFGVTSNDSKAFNAFIQPANELREELFPIFNDDRNREAVPAFSGDLEGNRHSPEYNFVGFPSKKPYEPIEKYIRHFTQEGDAILDPFCGSGGVALVASQCGRNAICVDASPLACRISKSYTTQVDPKDIDRAFALLDRMLDANRKKLYSTICHHSKQRVELNAIIWSETTRCIKCFELIAIADLRDKACPKCGYLVKARYERMGIIPWGALYKSSEHGNVLRTASDVSHKGKLAFEQYDFPTASSQEWDPSEKGFIDRPLMNFEGSGPWGVLWRPYHGDVRTVEGFFTKRNLWALCDIRNAIDSIAVPDDIKNVLNLALASIIHPASRQQRYYPGSTFPNMIMPGVLFFPAVHEEINVYKHFFSKKRSLVRGQTALNNRLGNGRTCIVQGSASDLDYIPSESIDYVFTDPPYSGRIQYGELLFLQESILNYDTSWLSKELIVNEVRGIDLDLWAVKLEQCMREVYRALKPGRWASVCFHDSNPASWVKLQDAMLNIGFIPGPADKANSMHTGWQTLKMHTSEDITNPDYS
jgi:DNA modification methylase/DNA-directed RNA polymerase subunit RPC12/RpoP